MEETIFNYIDSIIFNKRKLNNINENETGFNVYMVNRWCSMHSADISQIINETSNKYSKTFLTKQESYDFLYHIIPQKRKKRIQYLKKNKESKVEENTEVPYISNMLEISQREVNQYIDFLEDISK